ncbi:MAG: replicative DNA helicase [Sporolactobacillus sp.]
MDDIQLLGKPFFNLEAEQNYLACILFEGDLIKDSKLSAEHFADTRHKKIFKAMRFLEGKEEPVNVISIVSVAGKKLNEVGGTQYLGELINSVVSTANFEQCEKFILKAWKFRTAFEVSNEFQANLSDANEASIEKVISRLSDIEMVGSEKKYSFRDRLTEWYDNIEYRSQHDQVFTGIATGYSDLDVATGGLQEDDLIVIGARPSMGKTSFALNLIMGAAGNAEQPAVVDMYELEMRDMRMIDRMVSAQANIDSMYLRRPSKFFKDDTWQKITFSMGKLGNMDLNIYDDPLVSVTDIKARTRKRRRENPEAQIMIVIDYLQLLQTSGDGKNRANEIGEITRQLKIMARDLKVTVVLLSQLSRNVEMRNDKHPMMSDLRESGNIEQDADTILFLYRDDYYNRDSDKRNITEVMIAKQRNGAVGTVELAFLKEYNKFVNLDRRMANAQ